MLRLKTIFYNLLGDLLVADCNQQRCILRSLEETPMASRLNVFWIESRICPHWLTGEFRSFPTASQILYNENLPPWRWSMLNWSPTWRLKSSRLKTLSSPVEQCSLHNVAEFPYSRKNSFPWKSSLGEISSEEQTGTFQRRLLSPRSGWVDEVLPIGKPRPYSLNGGLESKQIVSDY